MQDGKIFESKDKNNIYSSFKYLDRFPVATFGNARQEECTYIGFESGGVEDGWNLAYGYISSLSHTGKHSGAIDGENTYRNWISKTFQEYDLDLSGKYIFGAWVKSTSNQTHIDLKYLHLEDEYSHNVYHSGSGEWEFLYTICDLSAYPEPLVEMIAQVRNKVQV